MHFSSNLVHAECFFPQSGIGVWGNVLKVVPLRFSGYGFQRVLVRLMLLFFFFPWSICMQEIVSFSGFGSSFGLDFGFKFVFLGRKFAGLVLVV